MLDQGVHVRLTVLDPGGQRLSSPFWEREPAGHVVSSRT